MAPSPDLRRPHASFFIKFVTSPATSAEEGCYFDHFSITEATFLLFSEIPHVPEGSYLVLAGLINPPFPANPCSMLDRVLFP